MTIGRSEPADIVVADDVISRVHCRIEPHGDSLQVTDLGSTNGTFVDGRRIADPTPLKSGTQFHLGDRAFGYERRDLASLFEVLSRLAGDPKLE